MTGEPVLVDLNEESDSEEQDFDAWEPDPVDADPSECVHGNQTLWMLTLVSVCMGTRSCGC